MSWMPENIQIVLFCSISNYFRMTKSKIQVWLLFCLMSDDPSFRPLLRTSFSMTAGAGGLEAPTCAVLRTPFRMTVAMEAANRFMNFRPTPTSKLLGLEFKLKCFGEGQNNSWTSSEHQHQLLLTFLFSRKLCVCIVGDRNFLTKCPVHCLFGY